MTSMDRRGLLAGGLALVAGCGPERVAERSSRLPKEGGIGGTGIIGTLTEFGSLMVNGRRVTLSRSTEYHTTGAPFEAGRLRAGHSLTVEAIPAGSGLIAERVRLVRPVVGRVGLNGGLTVGGVPVRLVPGVAGPGEPGGRVAVSGLWDGRQVVATLIEPAENGMPDLLAGTVRFGPRGPSIQGVVLDAPRFLLPPDGSFVTVLGRAEEGAFAVEDIVGRRFFGGREPLRRLSIEGYLEPIGESPGYAISGLGHSMDSAADVATFAGARALLEGPYTGDFEPLIGVALPEGAEDRRRLLAPGFRLTEAPGVRPAR